MPVDRNARSKRRILLDNEEFDAGEMFSQLGSSLLLQAVEPNMHMYKPHDKQLAFHSSDAHGRLYIGGNRSGKTTGGIVEDLWWVSKKHPYRRMPSDAIVRGRVIGVDWTTGTEQILLPQFKRWILPSMLINGSWNDSWSQTDRTLTLQDQSFIEFKSYDQTLEKHAGTSRHFIHFDEEPPQDIFKENMLRLTDVAGSWWMTMTPLKGMDWIYDVIYMPGLKGELQSVSIHEVSMDDNPYISKEERENTLQFLTPDERKQRVTGAFAERGGLIFPDFGRMHLIEGDWTLPRSWRVYMSLDHGLNNPTAALWHAVSPEGKVVTFAEHYASEMIVKDHARQMKAVEARLGLEIFARPGDPAMKQRSGITGTSIVQEYADYGIYLSVESIPRAVGPGIDKMKKYMQLGPNGENPVWQIVEDACPNLVRELGRLHWKIYANSKSNDSSNKIEEVHKKDDHAFDSTRYFFTMMPDLSPDEVWSMPSSKDPNHMQSYIETLQQMAQSSVDAVRSEPKHEKTLWELQSVGSNLESEW